MTRSHAVRAYVRRSPPRYSEDLHDRLRAEVVAEEIWSARVGPILVSALAEALEEFKPEDA